MQENLAAAKYEISRAVKADLAAITRIYNASVLERNATATLHPVGIEEHEAWFDVHEAANRPIYVLREVCDVNLTSEDGETFEADCERKFDSKGENFGAQKLSVTNPKGEILAWAALATIIRARATASRPRSASTQHPKLAARDSADGS